MSAASRVISGTAAIAVAAVIGIVVVTHHGQSRSSPPRSAGIAALAPVDQTLYAEHIPSVTLGKHGFGITLVDPTSVSQKVLSRDGANAVAVTHFGAGTGIVGGALANVTGLVTDPNCLCWIISADPGGGAYSAHGHMAYDYAVDFVDAVTGRDVLVEESSDSLLPPLSHTTDSSASNGVPQLAQSARPSGS